MTEMLDQPALTMPMDRKCPFAPPAEYAQLRETAPAAKVDIANGEQAWVLTRHEDVRAVLNDQRFSANRTNPVFPQLVERIQRREDNPFTPSLLGMDAPEHGPARRAVVGEFTVRRMEALRPRVQEIVDERIDAMLAAGGTVDLVEMFSLPVPSLVICELLGVPYADHDFFQSCTSKMLSRAVGPAEREESFQSFRKYLDDLVTAKEAVSTDDLLGRQIVKTREDGTFNHEALVGLAFLLLLAGHETTANMISLGTLALLENPGQLATITNDPGKTLEAVEELLRYFTITDTVTARLAKEDVEIGGVTIKAGEGIFALGASANRDPEAFENPDELDIERGARHHVAFGFGAHQCLGQNLARMELQVVYDTLFRRIPGLRLAKAVDDLPFKNDASIFGLHELPVTW
ncbi:cytochrome P450 [Amycolatopsis sp. H20-H5]|uniref:cytochrome P450 n=1 Tax=Amycolatopsis sp. H20-H5 TaxID=3046309 RepID=UPI002DBA4814|nr:cytochrome P450 [Amycolatopsis sp. H20-H5]MEC3979472.1 cytochrome P450 [Amycolatopsis sp. H20-H5]